jgi:hypothetical protein
MVFQEQLQLTITESTQRSLPVSSDAPDAAVKGRRSDLQVIGLPSSSV